MKRWLRSPLICSALCVLAAATGREALAQEVQGADVTYLNFTGTASYGPINGTRAYFFSSDTCNIGTVGLRWGSSWQGTPALATNMYRIHDGRIEQIGLSFAKQACCAAQINSGCGSCQPGGSSGSLFPGCKDVYGASYNASQGKLAARSQINAFTGAMTLASTTTGDAIFKRLQVRDTDINPASYPGAVWIGEGVYVANDDAPAGNAYNNASWKRVTVDQTTRAIGATTYAMNVGSPAIYAWAAHGGPAGAADPSVAITPIDIPGEGRVFLGSKVTNLGNGQYKYVYSIYNLNSDKGIGGLVLPVTNNAFISGSGQSIPSYHSGEPYVNAPWDLDHKDNQLSWRTAQSFSEQPNANALRWGTLYTYWFTCNAAPTSGSLKLEVFKTHFPQQLNIAATVPGPVCGTADFNKDGAAGLDADIEAFYLCIGGHCCETCQSADFDGDGGSGLDSDIEAFYRVLGGGSC